MQHTVSGAPLATTPIALYHSMFNHNSRGSPVLATAYAARSPDCQYAMSPLSVHGLLFTARIDTSVSPIANHGVAVVSCSVAGAVH